jgi:hypothetical protein
MPLMRVSKRGEVKRGGAVDNCIKRNFIICNLHRLYYDGESGTCSTHERVDKCLQNVYKISGDKETT